MPKFDSHALWLQAQACFDRGAHQEAARICELILKKERTSAKAHFLLYRVAVVQQRFDDAIRHAQKAIDFEPRHVPFRLALGAFLARQAQYNDAMRVLERAHQMAPNDIHVRACLADVFEYMGEPAKSRALLEPIIRDGQDDALIATIWARVALTLKDPDEAVRALIRHAGTAKKSKKYFFVLGAAYEKLGEVAKAFDAYSTANTLEQPAFSLDDFLSKHKALCRSFNRQTLRAAPHPQHATDLPIFIAGRPRSGTTLIEKILDAHPDVAGVGELPKLTHQVLSIGADIGSTLPYPECVRDLDENDVTRSSRSYLDCLRALAPGSRRVVDKHLSNYEHLGLVSLLFPQSRVLHIRRNALDNCWACFVADISSGWTANLRTLGATYRIYEGLMQHWHEQLDLQILDVDYEAVVEDQEGWTRRILDFCGLPFDDRCLRFYEATSNESNTNQVAPATLSYNQVRQPIYRSSVGRAAKFEPHLAPLHAGLTEGKELAKSLFA